MIGLGTGLRQLVDALDGSVDDIYRDAGLDFRARFYPFFRLLEAREPQSVGELAVALGFTQPAVTQSLALMRDSGLIERSPSADRRERRFRLSAKARAMLPELRRIWAATGRAAARLNAALPAPVEAVVERALRELTDHPFKTMIDEELRRAADLDGPDAAGTAGVPGRPIEVADRPG